MRIAFTILALTPFAVAAQPDARVGDVQVRARETSCWSNSQVPCNHVGRASLELTTTSRARVRVVGVEVRIGDRWVPATGILLSVDNRRITGSSVRLRPGATRRVLVYFDAIAFAGDTVIRTTLRVDGRRVRVEAPHVIWTESPDPEF